MLDDKTLCTGCCFVNSRLCIFVRFEGSISMIGSVVASHV